MTFKHNLPVLVSLAVLCGAASAESTLELCYQKANSEAEINACLKQELTVVRNEYRALVESSQKEAGERDRVTGGKNIIASSLEKSNVAFDRFVTEQCNLDKAIAGSGDAGVAANLSCQVNLLYWRMGILENSLSK